MFCVVDAHAITVPYDPERAPQEHRRRSSAIFSPAASIPRRPPSSCRVDVREHTELAWYLASVTPVGDLERMTQFKDKGEGKDFVSPGSSRTRC